MFSRIIEVLTSCEFSVSVSSNSCRFLEVFLFLLLVVAASLYNARNSRSSSGAVTNMATSMEEEQAISKGESPIQIKRNESFTFLDRAISNNPDPSHKFFECTPNQIEEVKRVLKILPIFASTIILNSCLAQLSTFSVQQASTMNTKLGS